MEGLCNQGVSNYDSYRMTCPVARVAKVVEGEAEAEQVVVDT